jgi:hypothetical protein
LRQQTLRNTVAWSYNLRAAMAWSLETAAADPAGQGERAVVGLRLVQALCVFWYQHGHSIEGRQWLERAMDLASADGGVPLARVAHGLGVLLDQQNESDAAVGSSSAAWPSGPTLATGKSGPASPTAVASSSVTSATWTPRGRFWKKPSPSTVSSAFPGWAPRWPTWAS